MKFSVRWCQYRMKGSAGGRRMSVEASPRSAPRRLVGAERVDVEIDDLDTALRLFVAVPGTPRPVAKPDIADPRQRQTAPIPAAWQARLARAAELERQRRLLPLGVTEEDGTEFARIAIIGAKNLPPAANGLGEELVILARHRSDSVMGRVQGHYPVKPAGDERKELDSFLKRTNHELARKLSHVAASRNRADRGIAAPGRPHRAGRRGRGGRAGAAVWRRRDRPAPAGRRAGAGRAA